MPTDKRRIVFPFKEPLGHTSIIGRSCKHFPMDCYLRDPIVPYSQSDHARDSQDMLMTWDLAGELYLGPGHKLHLTVFDEDRLPLLGALAPDSIDALTVSRTVSAPVVPYFAHLTGLRYLWLTVNCATDATLVYTSRLRSLTHLVLTGCGQLTDRGLLYLRDDVPLKRLAFHHTSVTGSFLAGFAGSPTLSLLRFIECEMLTESGLENLADLPALEHLELGSRAATDKTLSRLADLIRLKSLVVCGKQVTDRGLSHIVHLPRLAYLDLADTNLTDRSIPVLENMTTLQVLFLNSTRVSKRGVRRLREALPDCSIYYDPDTDPRYQ